MIKANELRIGNLIKFNNLIESEKIIYINARFFCSLANGRNVGDLKSDEEINNYYSPIPLTPDILEKCGFVRDEDSDIYQHDQGRKAFRIQLSEDPELYGSSILYKCDVGVNYDDLNSNIEYLHQLQNLYFALTGTELTVNL